MNETPVNVVEMPSFLGSLSPETLGKCRHAVRRAFMKSWPERHITLSQCDRMIEALGPAVMDAVIHKVMYDRQHGTDIDARTFLED